MGPPASIPVTLHSSVIITRWILARVSRQIHLLPSGHPHCPPVLPRCVQHSRVISHQVATATGAPASIDGYAVIAQSNSRQLAIRTCRSKLSQASYCAHLTECQCEEATCRSPSIYEHYTALKTIRSMEKDIPWFSKWCSITSRNLSYHSLGHILVSIFL